MRQISIIPGLLLFSLAFLSSCSNGKPEGEYQEAKLSLEELSNEFRDPPADCRAWVYWINMDGNFDMEGITADLESIKEAGLGGVLFMEVDLGLPRGNVSYMTPEWQEHMKHAMHECERLGLEFSLIGGPGWTGSGGPWVSAKQSMQHLLPVSVDVKGPVKFDRILPIPELRISKFHTYQTPETLEQIENWSEDVALFAFPKSDPVIEDIMGKALYNRNPYTSMMGVKPYLPHPSEYATTEEDIIDPGMIIDLSTKLDEEGRLIWEVPEGEWTILRLCSRSTGSISRPAPLAGVGLESNKFEKEDFDHHFETYVGKLMEVSGREKGAERPSSGWNTIQFESWEMSSQNWSRSFRDEFRERRGYDLWTYLPVLSGRVVESREISERFLWDLRQTSQDLILENHARHFLKRAHENGFQLHIEPHDMNPTTDMLLASVGDVPMAEFWTNHFNSAFSVQQASSVGHIYNKDIVAAEAFTSFMTCWSRFPYKMKDQGDWAFCSGINRFVFVQFTHQPWKGIKPGMGFGPHGIYWDRNQTFWPLVNDYHLYLARCQHMLRQGKFVADICYLLPEGAPNVFVPPPTAFKGDLWTPDRREYNFDACPPDALIRLAEVEDGKVVFPGGASYHILVLPDMKTMTPELLEKIHQLAMQGATIVGSPPLRAPGLTNYPDCDLEVDELVERIWGGRNIPEVAEMRSLGKGSIWWGGALSKSDAQNYDRNPADEIPDEQKNSDYSEGLFGHDGTRPGTPYPDYAPVAGILEGMKVPGDFTASEDLRYVHLKVENRDIFFVANRTDTFLESLCEFRTSRGNPQLWNPVTGEIWDLPVHSTGNNITSIPLEFDSYQSFFIVFDDDQISGNTPAQEKNFHAKTMLMELEGPWKVGFDPEWGGPGEVVFEDLIDWTVSNEDGIRYYSGIASYRKDFFLDPALIPEKSEGKKVYLQLGKVHDLAGVVLNGTDLGTVWTAPWQMELSDIVKGGENKLEIRVANRWPNRLIGDESKPYDGIVNGKFPEWINGNEKRSSGKYTYSTVDCFDADSPLLPSGLLGPVVLEIYE